MGLYDNFKLAQSRKVKEYQGSVVPELVAVSTEMQKRYDTAAEMQDYTKRFKNSMTALSQDQAALDEMWNTRYDGKLKELSARPDLENAVRESTMLARDLPQDYAPFAQRMKDFSERKEELTKATQKKPGDAGYLTPEDADRILRRDIALDKGISKDPATGRYVGRFQGKNYVSTFDMQKAVDTIMDKQFPTTEGMSVEEIVNIFISAEEDNYKRKKGQGLLKQQIKNNGTNKKDNHIET